MDIRNRSALKSHAQHLLDHAAYNPRKLVAIHCGVSLGIPLILALFNLLLSQQISHTGGLAGIGTRNVLTTIQTMLQLAVNILSPFWSVGYLYAALRTSRQEPATPGSLLEGFRRFAPLLRLMLIISIVYMGVIFLAAQIGTLLALPFCRKLMVLLQPIQQQLMEDPYADPYALMMQIPQQQLLDAMSPALIGTAIILCVILIPILFRLRFAEYSIMDKPRTGALAAMLNSFRMTRRNCKALLRLDLSFWWFYLLRFLALVLNFGNDLLPAMGITLPFSDEVSVFVFYGLYSAATLALTCLAVPYVETTYAAAYDSLSAQLPELQLPGFLQKPNDPYKQS